MPLQGTLDAFSLDEVLQMLGHARKTGALEVDAPSRVGGTIYFAGGRVCGAESGELTGKVASAEELEARLIDVCFALLRVEEGSFAFEPDRLPSWPVGSGLDVEPVLETVRGLVRDWSAIEDVIPSFESQPTVARELSGDTITLDRDAWAVVSAVDGHTDVRGMARELGRSVLDVAGVLKDLVATGAVTIDGVAPTMAAARDSVPSHAVAVDLSAEDLSAEERAAPEERVVPAEPDAAEPLSAEPIAAATVAGAAPRRDVTPFDVSELVAAQAEAERDVAGSVDTTPTPSAAASSARVDAPAPLAEAVAEVAAMAEGTAPPPVVGPRPPSQDAAPPTPAPPAAPPAGTASTPPSGSASAWGRAEGEADPDNADSADDGERGSAEKAPEPPKPTARNRGEALRMFSSLRRT